MKVRVDEIHKTSKTVEVSFPLYRKCVYYFKHDNVTRYEKVIDCKNHLVCYDLTLRNNNEFELKIDNDYFFDGEEEEDYLLGKEEYSCSPDEFYKALQQCKTLLSRLELRESFST